MKKILFVCTGNTCRSSMAEALFKHLLLFENLDSSYMVHSAGTSVYMPGSASDHAIKAISELEIDMRNHESKALTKEMIEESDLVLTMTMNHKAHILSKLPHAVNKVYTLKEYIEMVGDVADPYGGDIQTYRDCRDDILDSLKSVLEKLKMEGK